MAYFQNKNTNLGKFWRALQWKTLVYFVAIWYILWLFVIFSRFGMLYHLATLNSTAFARSPYACAYSGNAMQHLVSRVPLFADECRLFIQDSLLKASATKLEL
jgi:hypothetical protein